MNTTAEQVHSSNAHPTLYGRPGETRSQCSHEVIDIMYAPRCIAIFPVDMKHFVGTARWKACIFTVCVHLRALLSDTADTTGCIGQKVALDKYRTN